MNQQNQIQLGDDGAKLAAAVDDNTILVAVSFHKMGIKRKLKAERIKSYADSTSTDPTMLKASKELVASPEYDKILQRDGETYRELKRRIVQDRRLKEGVYRLPVKMLDWFEEFYGKYEAERGELVDAFVGVYEERVLEAEGQLGDLFDPAQYPQVEDVRASFSMEKEYMVLGTPDKLRKLNPELFGKERQRLLKSMEDSAQEIRLAMRRTLLELVAHLSDKLKAPPKGGKKKRLHETTVENLREWLELLESRNITNDADLQRLSDNLKGIMDGADRDTLRDDEAVRGQVQLELKKAQKSLTGMVKEGPRRKRALVD